MPGPVYLKINLQCYHRALQLYKYNGLAEYCTAENLCCCCCMLLLMVVMVHGGGVAIAVVASMHCSRNSHSHKYLDQMHLYIYI